ncbi:MAG: hypothetical protein Q8Q60_02295 [Candidatus Chromulinivorax sp.]|nr:hypothetical protein [Candidatus Chromulinivorax sp.]
MKSTRNTLLFLAFIIGQICYIPHLNSSVNQIITADNLAVESLCTPEMVETVILANPNIISLSINRQTGEMTNLPSIQTMMNNLPTTEATKTTFHTLLEATEIALFVQELNSKYDGLNFNPEFNLKVKLEQQKQNIQNKINAISKQQSFYSWAFGANTSTNLNHNQTNIHIDAQAPTITIPVGFMPAIAQHNNYKTYHKTKHATEAANLLFHQIFIAQQHRFPNPIALQIHGDHMTSEHYIYHGFPSFYALCDSILKLNQSQRRSRLLQIRQAVQTALFVANRKSAANIGYLIPQSAISYLDGVVAELLRYDNHMNTLCMDGRYGATQADIAKAPEWSTLSKVAAGVVITAAVVGVGALAYDKYNNTNNVGETIDWFSGASGKKVAEDLKKQGEEAAAKVLEAQRIEKLAEEKRIQEEAEVKRLKEESDQKAADLITAQRAEAEAEAQLKEAQRVEKEANDKKLADAEITRKATEKRVADEAESKRKSDELNQAIEAERIHQVTIKVNAQLAEAQTERIKAEEETKALAQKLPSKEVDRINKKHMIRNSTEVLTGQVQKDHTYQGLAEKYEQERINAEKIKNDAVHAETKVKRELTDAQELLNIKELKKLEIDAKLAVAERDFNVEQIKTQTNYPKNVIGQTNIFGIKGQPTPVMSDQMKMLQGLQTKAQAEVTTQATIVNNLTTEASNKTEIATQAIKVANDATKVAAEKKELAELAIEVKEDIAREKRAIQDATINSGVAITNKDLDEKLATINKERARLGAAPLTASQLAGAQPTENQPSSNNQPQTPGKSSASTIPSSPSVPANPQAPAGTATPVAEPKKSGWFGFGSSAQEEVKPIVEAKSDTKKEQPAPEKKNDVQQETKTEQLAEPSLLEMTLAQINKNITKTGEKYREEQRDHQKDVDRIKNSSEFKYGLTGVYSGYEALEILAEKTKKEAEEAKNIAEAAEKQAESVLSDKKLLLIKAQQKENALKADLVKKRKMLNDETIINPTFFHTPAARTLQSAINQLERDQAQDYEKNRPIRDDAKDAHQALNEKIALANTARKAYNDAVQEASQASSDVKIFRELNIELKIEEAKKAQKFKDAGLKINKKLEQEELAKINATGRELTREELGLQGASILKNIKQSISDAPQIFSDLLNENPEVQQSQTLSSKIRSEQEQKIREEKAAEQARLKKESAPVEQKDPMDFKWEDTTAAQVYNWWNTKPTDPVNLTLKDGRTIPVTSTNKPHDSTATPSIKNEANDAYYNSIFE